MESYKISADNIFCFHFQKERKLNSPAEAGKTKGLGIGGSSEGSKYNYSANPD